MSSKTIWGGRRGRSQPADKAEGKSFRSGFTLVEVSLAIGIGAIAALGFTQSIIKSMVASNSEREITVASEAARQVIETMKGLPLDEVFLTYNDNQWDDPGEIGSAPGAHLEVVGLEALTNDEDGMPLEVIFPVQWSGMLRPELREDVVAPWLGMPRDLNADGEIDSVDHALDYRLLPVLIRVQWRGSSGPARIELRTMLADNGL